MFKKGLFLGGGNAVNALLNLARNLLVARLVSVEDFGVAATFAVTMAFLEMVSQLSVNRLVVQAPDGDEPKLMAAMHGIELARGLLMGALLFALAGPIAALFGVPDIAWAYQVLALAPAIRALTHLDVVRLQRRLSFRPVLMVDFITRIVSLVAVYPLFLLLGDWRVVLALVVGMPLLRTALTHVVAERPFALGWDREVFRRALSFGLPLLVNGALMFLVFQGDRIVVGNQIGLEELGLFSAAVTLVMTPALLISQTLRQMLLPLLSRVQEDPEEFSRLFALTMQLTLLAGTAFLIGSAIFGPAALVLLFGEKYAGALGVLLWLALMFAFRVAKVGPSEIAVSRTLTTNPMIANVVRCIAFPIAFALAAQGYSMVTVVAVGAAAEFASLLTSILLLKRTLGLSRLDALAAPYALVVAQTALLAVWTTLDPATLERIFDVSWVHAAMLALFAAQLAVSRGLRDFLKRRLAKRFPRLAM